MADQTLPPRPTVTPDAEGRIPSPEGYTLVLIDADRETVMAGWTIDGTFWAWESTEKITRTCMTALAELQLLLPQLPEDHPARTGGGS